MKRSVTLIILDGYGLAPPSDGNAIAAAHTPVLDALYRDCPNTTLSASGEDVGLPPGQIGNSEVGHTNLGAGRVVEQELKLINQRIESGDFFANRALASAMNSCKNAGQTLHLMGLVSPGGVHSHSSHLYALLGMAKQRGLSRVYVHCFTDGRDVPPASAKEYVAELRDKIAEIGCGAIASVTGRIYAMDRDERYDRLERAYRCLTRGEGTFNPDAVDAVAQSYGIGVTDEFIAPVICDYDGVIKPRDTVIFFNFRAERARELTRAFVDPDFAGFIRPDGLLNVNFVCMTQYDEEMPNVTVAYPPEGLHDTLGEIISAHGLKQLRTAETTKYAHVTFFLSGGEEKPFPGEDRILVPTPTEYATFDLIPQMSAFKVAETAAERIRSGTYDFVAINFANCDMVGHTGSYDAAVQAVEAVDTCVGTVLEAVRETGGIAIVTADHGNAEWMLEDGKPMTAHTTNPVPFILIGADYVLQPGRLCDVAPTILELMNIEIPPAMTGNSLLLHNTSLEETK